MKHAKKSFGKIMMSYLMRSISGLGKDLQINSSQNSTIVKALNSKEKHIMIGPIRPAKPHAMTVKSFKMSVNKYAKDDLRFYMKSLLIR